MIDLGLLCLGTIEKHKLSVPLDINKLTELINRDFNIDATIEEVKIAYSTLNIENNIVEQEEDFV